MTESDTDPSIESSRFADVLTRMKVASRLVDVNEVRFLECQYSYGPSNDDPGEAVHIGVRGQDVAIEDDSLRSTITLEFRAPSPFDDNEAEKAKRAFVRAKVEVKYVLRRENGDFAAEAVDTFARVNGLQTAWPYFREYLHSSLVRLGLPAFDLPLLKPLGAARLAGLVEPRGDDATAAKKPSESQPEGSG